MSALLAEVTEGRADGVVRPGDDTISVMIFARDPISRAGVERHLFGAAEISVLPLAHGRHPNVALVVADTVDDQVLGWIRKIRAASMSRVVVIAGVNAQAAAGATDAGAHGVIPRSMADQRRLVWAVQKVHRGETVALFSEVRSEPAPPVARTLTPEGSSKLLSERDREVLRLLAEGCDTGEIARSLAYSEPTIKNAIQRLFEQLNAKNRPHAVALALRLGII